MTDDEDGGYNNKEKNSKQSYLIQKSFKEKVIHNSEENIQRNIKKTFHTGNVYLYKAA